MTRIGVLPPTLMPEVRLTICWFECFWQDFDRDGVIQTRVACFVDLAHSAGAERGLDFVGAEARSGS